MKEAPVPMMITNFTRPGLQAYLILQDLNQRLDWCLHIICFSDCRMKTNFITQVIYLPGDNDIGGEGTDHVTQSKIERFNANFPNQIESVYGNIQFVVVIIAY